MPTREKEKLKGDKDQEKNPYETLLIQYIKEEELKPSYMYRWSILSDIIKYVQHDQHSIGHYGLEVKAPAERYGTKTINSYRMVRER